MNDYMFSLLLSSLENQKTIHTISYHSNILGECSVGQILSIVKSKYLKELWIDSIKCHGRTLGMLISGLSDLVSTTPLFLRGFAVQNIKLDESSMKNLILLISKLKSVETLKEINLSWNAIPEKLFGKLLDAFTADLTTSNLTYIDLSYNSMVKANSKVFEGFVSYLKFSKTLTHLNLNSTQLVDSHLS